MDARDVDPSSGASSPLPQLRERIASDLTELGFRVAASGGARVIPIEARVRLRRVERGTDWVEFRWEGSAAVGSPVPGAPAVLVVEGEGAESHPEAGTARLRARRKAEVVMAQRLRRDLEAFLEPEAELTPGAGDAPR